jgi:hypothetical protein
VGIVDSHVHLLPSPLADKVRAFFEAHISRELVYPIEHRAVLDALARAGVVEVWSLPYSHNREIAAGLNAASAETVQALAAHPVRVIGGATIHPEDEAPERLLREAFEHHRLRVLKLHCSVGKFDADDQRLDPTWAFVTAHRIPVVVHLGHATSGHTRGEELLPVARVAERFPEARVIIAHCGHPAMDQALDLVERHAQVYADLTPVVADPVRPAAERIVRVAHKLLFGSDAPNVAIPVEQSIAALRALALGPEVENDLFGGTARRLVAAVAVA